MTWEYKGGTGRWQEFVNEKGESSIKEHTLKTIWKSCKEKDHVWKLTNNANNNREVECEKCGLIRSFVLGREVLIDGKIIPLK